MCRSPPIAIGLPYCESQEADFTSIFFCCSSAFAVFGTVMLSTPFEKSAEIWSRSTPSGL
jgi:hypothetical protein